MPELRVTPRYITRKSPCNVGVAPMEGSLPISRVFRKIGFLDQTPHSALPGTLVLCDQPEDFLKTASLGFLGPEPARPGSSETRP
jgi:hypothetical protein